MHFETRMNALVFGVKRLRAKVTALTISPGRGTGLDAVISRYYSRGKAFDGCLFRAAQVTHSHKIVKKN